MSDRPRPTRLPELLDDWMYRTRQTNHSVAEELGLSDRHGWRQVSRWRNGTAPNRDNEHALAKLLGVAVTDFYEPGVFDAGGTRDELLERVRRLEELVERMVRMVEGRDRRD